MCSFSTIDCRCEDGRHPVSASCVIISNPYLLLSSKTGVNPGMRRFKKQLIWLSLIVRKPLGLSILQKKSEGQRLQPGLEFDNFKPWLETGIFKCISWLNGSSFGEWWSGFSERGIQDLSSGTDVASLLANLFFLCLHIYSVCLQRGCTGSWLNCTTNVGTRSTSWSTFRLRWTASRRPSPTNPSSTLPTTTARLFVIAWVSAKSKTKTCWFNLPEAENVRFNLLYAVQKLSPSNRWNPQFPTLLR